MSGHITGPWVVHEDGSPFVYALGANGNNVFSANLNHGGCHSESASDEQLRATACLIAAAPDLLKAAKEMMASITGEASEWAALLSLQDAIAKAESVPTKTLEPNG